MNLSSSKAVWYTTLAAGAAASSTARGAVIFTDVLPDLTARTIEWDLDNGGANDFRIEVALTGNEEKSNLAPINPGAGIALTLNGNVDRKASGETIGIATTFSNPTEVKTLFDEVAPANHDWSVGSRGFLGLRISLNGNTHYAWADISINPAAGSSFDHTLHAYAYENVANASIPAGAVPEPTTALLLVAGAAGAASIRRRRA